MALSNLRHYLTVKDHSVSGESFDLYLDEILDMLVTYPKPDEKELGKYYDSEDYISHTDGKRSFFEVLYHFIKNIALKNKINLINSLQPNNKTLLDIGAGTGDFLLRAKKGGWKTTGIEPNSKAKSIAIEKGIVFSETTQDLPDHSFEVITMWHVLEHVPDVLAQIKELKRLIAPDGNIIIAVPNFNAYDAKYYNGFWAAYDVPRHLSHFSKKAIKLIFQNEKLEIVNIYPMKFDAYYVSLLSEKYKSGKMNFVKAFIVGFKSNYKAKQSLEYSSHIYILKNTKN